MKLAFLGMDDYLLRLAEAAAADADAQLALLCETGAHAAALHQLHPAAHIEGDWENLLVGGEFDVLVVGASHIGASIGASDRALQEGDELRTEQLRRLVQEAVPTVLVHPAAEAIVLHELAMIQHDTGGLLAAWNPLLAHPAVEWMEENLQVGGAAPVAIAQVAVHRALEDPTWPRIQTQLARDAQWLRRLIGPPNRVTALAPAGENQSLQNLAVTLAGSSTALAQWTVSAAGLDRITVTGGARQAVWESAPDGGESKLTVRRHDDEFSQSWNQAESDAHVGRRFLAYLRKRVETDGDAAGAGHDFDAACRAVETAEAARDGVRRGRTIALHYEEHSEQQTFKSVMAAGGCLLLLLAPLLLGVSMAIDSIGAPVRNSVWWRIWPVYLLAPLVAFLLLQSLWRVFASPRPADTKTTDDSSELAD